MLALWCSSPGAHTFAYAFPLECGYAQPVTSVISLHYIRVPRASGLSLETLFLTNWPLRNKAHVEGANGGLQVTSRKTSEPSVLTLQGNEFCQQCEGAWKQILSS